MQIHSGQVSESDGEEDELDDQGNPLLRAMGQFASQGYGPGTMGGPSAGHAPSFGARPGYSASLGGNAFGDGGEQRARGLPMTRVGEDPHSLSDMNMAVQMEMLRVLQSMQTQRPNGDHLDHVDDLPSNHLDGLRITRNLSRMRALAEDLEKSPKKVHREYRHRWVKSLGKEAGGFRWHDRNRAIKWKKFTSMRRVDFMFCQILESMEQGKTAYAQGQVVQCMKALHEFSKLGSWRAAWPLTYMVDPFDLDGHGGDDVEMEVIMSYLRTKDDLRSKVAGARVEDLQSEGNDAAEGEDGDAAGAKKRANRKKTSKDRTAGASAEGQPAR